MNEQIVLCPRCFLACRIGGKPSNPDARPLKLAKSVKHGLCANCAFTAFIKSIEVFGYGIARNGVGVFRDPRIQKDFASLFAIGESDADISEIDWEVVIENWDLAIPLAGNPCRVARITAR